MEADQKIIDEIFFDIDRGNLYGFPAVVQATCDDGYEYNTTPIIVLMDVGAKFSSIVNTLSQAGYDSDIRLTPFDALG